MSNGTLEVSVPGGRILTLIASSGSRKELQAVSKALGSDKRLAILQFLGNHTCSVLEIAEALDLPFSTTTQHINILQKAGLITTDLQPSTRGLKKVCARVFDQVVVQLPTETRNQPNDSVKIEMPVGAYTSVMAYPTCGLVGEIGIIGHLDDPTSFYEPEHIYAQLVWLAKGWIEYVFPTHLPADAVPIGLEISFEACSEAPLHHNQWPSDITLWIDQREIGTWTCPADFGGRRGALTPDWWDEQNTQFGLLKIWKVTPNGSFIDGIPASRTNLSQLAIPPGGTVTVRIGIKDGAHNVGGINLFGRKFGNYPQDIVLKLFYRRGGK